MAKLSDHVVAEHLPGFTFTDMSSDKGLYFQQVAEHPLVGRDTHSMRSNCNNAQLSKQENWVSLEREKDFSSRPMFEAIFI